MEVLVRNADGNVSQRDRDYAAKKLGRLDRYFNAANKVEMVHREDGAGHRIEITVFADGFTVRGEEVDRSVHAAIDLVSDKIEERLRKLKGRIVKSYRKRGHGVPTAFMAEAVDEVRANGHFELRERKQFLVKPMSIEEAALQMDLIDHPFFVFRDEDSNQIAVLYKRKDNKYGLLEPEA
ncbi:MAG TPA: ribosome-associated translation inhibitor RaiA [Fimbriimonadaceae bacterium]|jgi:putative sigma-54 modulation protein